MHGPSRTVRRRPATGAGKVKARKLSKGSSHELASVLPDLETTTEFEVIAKGCRIVGALICASALDELKAFEVVDRIAEKFRRGDLPLKGRAGRYLVDYWREAPGRMSEAERRASYASVFGGTTDQSGVAINKDFQSIWLRFISSVSSFAREANADRLTRLAPETGASEHEAKKAAGDLTANIAGYSSAVPLAAAGSLQKQIEDMIKLLGDEELRAAFGAADMWQVIEQVAAAELGVPCDASKHRCLASSGMTIACWLADNVSRICDTALPFVDFETRPTFADTRSGEPISNPSDDDLFIACDRWLIASGLGKESSTGR
jgi:hypothetical protein